LLLLCLQSFLYQILKAVHHAHMHCVMHRDLKPQNILVDASHQQVSGLQDSSARSTDGSGGTAAQLMWHCSTANATGAPWVAARTLQSTEQTTAVLCALSCEQLCFVLRGLRCKTAAALTLLPTELCLLFFL
jgi:serine/threonine protein kinase